MKEKLQDELTRQSAWSDYRRRRLRLFFIAIGGLFFIQDKPLFPAIWLLLSAISCLYLMSFRCPRCDNTFLHTSWFGNPFATQCMHCGLPKWTEVALPAKIAASSGKRVLFYVQAFIIIVGLYTFLASMVASQLIDYSTAAALAKDSALVKANLGDIISITRVQTFFGIHSRGTDTFAVCYFRIKGSKASATVKVTLAKTNDGWTKSDIEIMPNHEIVNYLP